MKIVRFSHNHHEQLGVLEGEEIRPLQGALDQLVPVPGAKPTPLKAARLLAPVVPGKIVAIGLNYRDHAAERGNKVPTEPLIFLKPSTCVIGPGDAIIYPPQTSNLHYEGELAVVIAKRARNVSRAQARSYVLGYTCLNDVTARDLQDHDVQFTRGKSFDTFAPIGPMIVTSIDPSDLAIETRLNGEVRQHSRTSNLVFDCDYLISYVSQVMTLMPGDVITTGTPGGIGPMKVGDTVEVEIEGIGCLRNTIAAPA